MITTPLPHPVFRNPSLKAFGEFKPVSASCLDSLLGACNKLCTCLQPKPVAGTWPLLHLSAQTRAGFRCIRRREELGVWG